MNSITFGPASVNISPTYRNPRNAMALRRHSRNHRIDDLLHDAVVQRGVDERARRERAHAAGVRAAIVVENPLVILGRAD